MRSSGLLLLAGYLISSFTIGTLQHALHATNWNEWDDEEKRNKAYPFFQQKSRHGTALTAMHGVNSVCRTPSEKMCANDKHIYPFEDVLEKQSPSKRRSLLVLAMTSLCGRWPINRIMFR